MAANVSSTACLLENNADTVEYLKLGHGRGVDPDPNFPFQIKVLSSSSPDLKTTTDPAPPIQVVFAPTDFPLKSTVDELSKLFQKYKFPSAYRLERVQSVTYAFGARETDCWLHFLCKHIQMRRSREAGGFVPINDVAEDHSWNAAGYFLSWSHVVDLEENGGGIQEKREGKRISNVTLICSGAPVGLENRLKEFLAVSSNVDVIMQDPYALWIPVLMESWILMDDTVWYLQELFGKLENQTIKYTQNMSNENWNTKFEVDFQRLHNLAKHIIHLKEGSDAILYSLEALQKGHKDMHMGEGMVRNATKKSFDYTANLFWSTNVRLSALEKKVDNIINLAFHLVGQQDTRQAKIDSKIFLKDSANMRVIAVVTMLFLPGTAIATLFGSNFFSMSSSGKFVQSGDFWIFWVVALPVSIITFLWWIIALRKKEDVEENRDARDSEEQAF
ncbi:hypothetical protein BDD12DRAFT_913790 [Trichophaea hybrida]|nr:hypothetical protein BDD12DRAFT_913790 [Trichophaea hybrida]